MAFRNPFYVTADEIATGEPGEQRVVVSNTPGQRVRFETGSPDETVPGTIDSDYLPSPPNTPPAIAYLAIGGPAIGPPTVSPRLFLITKQGEIGGFAELIAEHITLTGQTTVTEPAILESSWSPITLVNSWVPVAGFTVGSYKDAAGNVHVRGAITAGTATTIGTLGVDSRPTQLTEPQPLRATAGAGVQSSVQVLTNGNIVIVTNLASAQARLAFDFSFPAAF